MLSSSLETARATITALKTDTTRVRTELRQMQRAVEAQNDSIDVLRQKARRLEVDVRTAERDGRRTRLVSERDAARILATPATDTSCTVAIRRAVHYADSLSSRWD